MNYRLLLGIFIISTSFCLLSAKTNALETSQGNVITQKESVVVIDVKSKPDSGNTFLQSLVKDIKSDQVEYKNGKIFIYLTPSILPIIIMTIIGTIGGYFSTGLLCFLCAFADFNIETLTLTILFIVSAFLTSLVLYGLYNYYTDLKFQKNPLITIRKKGVQYKNGPLISWDDIDNILQSKVSIYTDGIHTRTYRTLTCMGIYGEELFEMSESCWRSPIAYEQMIKLLNKAILHLKKNQDSPEK